MATREQLKNLKADWLDDPCWDIEDTEGFEEHYEELKPYRLEVEKAAKEKQEKERQQAIDKRVSDLNCSRELAEYTLTLETRLNRLQAEFDEFVYKYRG